MLAIVLRCGSGCGLRKCCSFVRGLEERYEELCEVVSTRSILSLGVAAFTWQRPGTSHMENSDLSQDPGPEVTQFTTTEDSDSEAHQLRVEVFNVWLLCGRPYTIDPSSASFLVAHGFDFNKHFSLGLPYLPSGDKDKVGVVVDSCSADDHYHISS